LILEILISLHTNKLKKAFLMKSNHSIFLQKIMKNIDRCTDIREELLKKVPKDVSTYEQVDMKRITF